MRPSGLRWVVQKTGTGPKPQTGNTIAINLKGMLLSGKVFDNSDLTGGARDIVIGTAKMIPGLDETIKDMTAGEKRTVIIPPELAYGARGLDRGQENVIPPNSFVVFEIEALRIK